MRKIEVENVEEVAEGAVTAEVAGLRYVNEGEPGITRRRAGKGFGYRGPDGAPIRDRAERRRIEALAVPPAYADVWICADARGHIQATGRDDRGRKQYRYHDRWSAARSAGKFDRLIPFAETLPSLRARVSADLRKHGLSRERVLASVVRLLETTLIRVGNASYARDNRSFGLTTLRAEHVDVGASTVAFDFVGKGGKAWSVKARDRRVASVLRGCEDLPGQNLFQYVDEAGEPRIVQSDDVNDYLREIAGRDFTAKDFRTWSGTVLAATALEGPPPETKTARKKAVVDAIKRVAARLGNTPAVCRSGYVHPAVIAAYEAGQLGEPVAAGESGDDPDALSPEEGRVLALLRAAETGPPAG